MNNRAETQVNVTETPTSFDLKPCQVCGRTFNPQSLEKHQSICEKSKKLIRRNVFNSYLQRAKDITGVPSVGPKKEEKCRPRTKSKKNTPETKSVKEPQNGDDACVGLSPQKTMLAGYERCPTCHRCFNQKAADRHIRWCHDQQTRLVKMVPNMVALERLKARTKYRAPLPRRRSMDDPDKRLVKSAECLRSVTVLRTNSSPPIQNRSCSEVQRVASHSPLLAHRKTLQRSTSGSSNVQKHQVPILKPNETQAKDKKAVKFKEKFPEYCEEKARNKDVDILTALRMRLSKLETSNDSVVDDDFESPLPLIRTDNGYYQIESSTGLLSDLWSCDADIRCSSDSSGCSDTSLPSLGRSQRMPRFCYNCGTKYPVVSAKYCCECGARRLVLSSANDNCLPATFAGSGEVLL